METHITIDLGNTNPHMGTFCANKLTDIQPFSEDNIKSNEIPLLISKVGSKDILKSKKIQNQILDFSGFFKHHSFLGMPVNYADTLGQDRLYLAYFIYKNCCQINSQFSLHSAW